MFLTKTLFNGYVITKIDLVCISYSIEIETLELSGDKQFVLKTTSFDRGLSRTIYQQQQIIFFIELSSLYMYFVEKKNA